jgi:hypothetical protein
MARLEYFDFIKNYGENGFFSVFKGDMNHRISKEGYLACFCKRMIGDWEEKPD